MRVLLALALGVAAPALAAAQTAPALPAEKTRMNCSAVLVVVKTPSRTIRSCSRAAGPARRSLHAGAGAAEYLRRRHGAGRRGRSGGTGPAGRRGHVRPVDVHHGGRGAPPGAAVPRPFPRAEQAGHRAAQYRRPGGLLGPFGRRHQLVEVGCLAVERHCQLAVDLRHPAGEVADEGAAAIPSATGQRIAAPTASAPSANASMRGWKYGFNSPFKARNFADFWRRWHITLSKFLGDYVFRSFYKKGAGSRNFYTAIFITFLVSGFWHGAGWNFVVWGIINGLFVMASHAMSRANRSLPFLLAWSVTFLGVVLLRVMY